MGLRASTFSNIKRFHDPQTGLSTAKLLPGEFYVTDQEEVISTVLGSCVSACLYDAQVKCGGMNHFMLPGEEGKGDADASARYGLYAMESLLNEMLKRGCRKDRIKAKLFGGGQIIQNMTDVGQKNIRFAKKFLFAEGITMESSDLGLIYPRKVNFFPVSGKAMVKRLNTLHTSIEDQEIRYMQSINKKPVSGDIELF